ncbi:MAG: hypothetical protein EYC62_01370 [Alphaproteobacteria bacterium]|nr:MAG: hypothetical protein EYC62_01370 [Alphaproteobacteria bacterium]
MDIALPATTADMMRPEAKLPEAAPKNLPAMKKAAQDFESVFLNEMMQQMFAGIKTNSQFGGGHGEDMFRSMMVQEYANAMSQKGGLGISDAILKEMIKIQGAAK